MSRFRAVVVAALAVLAVVPFAGSSQAGTVYRIPPGITSDCTRDVTQPILSWIASVPDNSVLSFGKKACYRIDGTLELTGRTGLVLEGNGSTFQASGLGEWNRSQWRVLGGSHLVFRHMKVRGANSAVGRFFFAREWQHAFDLRGAANVDIGHVSASRLFGDCVYVGLGSDGRTWSSNVHLHDMTCSRNGRMGFSVVAGRNVLVERNRVSKMALAAFHVEPNGDGYGAENITFTRNHAWGAFPGGFFNALGYGVVNGVTVSYNRVSHGSIYMAALAPPGRFHSNIRIIGNTSTGGSNNAGSAALDFARVRGLVVTRNRIPLRGRSMALASVQDSCGVHIFRNRNPGGNQIRWLPRAARARGRAPCR